MQIALAGLERRMKTQTTALTKLSRRFKQEIKERIEIEAAFKKTYQKFTRIFENIQDVYYELSLDQW